MKKILYLFIFTFLFGRINPFEPVVTPSKQNMISPEYFKDTKVYLPDDARVLKKIVFVYQNVNGDIKQKEVKIDKYIDFHKPIYISHSPKKFKIKRLTFLDLFTMYIKDKKILIETNDKLIRHFFLVDPFRIVLDFKREADFLTIKRALKNHFIKKIVVGNHKGYYRVVIYFDAKYLYKLTKLKEGIKIELR
ncbi:MAG TPA: AMIN domain-containing protein [Nautiliaceae bacterium]|nr:AMIN domain-containing protein [Nautiliaceae bacterium]